MKNSVLVTISLILSVAIGLAFSNGGKEAAAEAGSGDKKIVIGLSMDTLKEARWIKDRDIFMARAKELGAEVKAGQPLGLLDATAKIPGLQLSIIGTSRPRFRSLA